MISIKNGWLCSKCQSFALGGSASNPWISTGATLGHHPTRKMKKHFQSNLHLQSIQSEQIFKRPSVYNLISSFDQQTVKKKEMENRIVVKSMFSVALYMVKHCQPNDSFEDMIKLVAENGSSELKKHLSEGARNAQYLNHHSYRELLQVMNDYVEEPLLEAARSQPFTIFIDETTAVGNKSMACVYLMFDDGKEVMEHFLGIINMNTGLGLTARHYYNATVELCRSKIIPL